jgi:hypothetical protein
MEAACRAMHISLGESWMGAIMLIADIRGHPLAEAQSNEDYLTSAVFGHLRYVPPTHFWDKLLQLARGLPGEGERSVADLVRQGGQRLSAYRSLEVFFWPEHKRRGIPDLLLSFSGPRLRPITIVIEVKLWSGKSGEEDQLLRYLHILDELQDFCDVAVPHDSLAVLIYLTPRESANEILDSLRFSENPEVDRKRIFRLRWQDFIRACKESLPTGDAIMDMIVRDVGVFLTSRGLEPFEGFRRLEPLPELRVKKAGFNLLFVQLHSLPEMRVLSARFNRLFVRLSVPHSFAPRRAPWKRQT